MDQHEAIEQMRTQMESLGISIVDVSVYPVSKKRNFPPYNIVIMVGHLPGKACLFTVNGNLSSNDVDILFNLNAEMETDDLMRKVDRKLWRSSPSGETLKHGYGVFSFGHYQSAIMHQITVEEIINGGISFYSRFLKNFKQGIKESFTCAVTTAGWMPWKSDTFVKRAKKYGEFSDATIKPFEQKIISKLPTGLICPEQMSRLK
jgi:hypothetical protein